MHTVYYSPNGGEIAHISDARDEEWERDHTHGWQGYFPQRREYADDALPADRATTLTNFVVGVDGALISRLRLGGTAPSGVDVAAVVRAALAEAMKANAAANQEAIKRAVIEALAAERAARAKGGA